MKLVLAASVLMLAAVAGEAAAQEPQIVVERSRDRLEIERVLQADNLDLGSMSPRQVAEAMARIPKGQAPDEFWARYQGHVRAWQWYAALASTPGVNGHDVVEAEAMVNATFGDVERIAARYAARLPKARPTRE